MGLSEVRSGSFGADLRHHNDPKSTPNDPDRTSDELYPHPYIADHPGAFEKQQHLCDRIGLLLRWARRPATFDSQLGGFGPTKDDATINLWLGYGVG